MSIINLSNYKKLITQYKHIFNGLYKICIEIGEPVEGNCFSQHLNISRTIPQLVYKQMNLVSLGSSSNNIMEIDLLSVH